MSKLCSRLAQLPKVNKFIYKGRERERGIQRRRERERGIQRRRYSERNTEKEIE
jgi:hypothetical protein